MTPRKLSIAHEHQEIAAHSYRLMRPARAIACVLGLSPHEVSRVGMAALLHDVGKLAIPTSILGKPGPLSSEEWTIMHRHPEIGNQMLSQAGGDWTGLGPIVAAHHEHWDGGGYPTGLAKEAIPFEARILSVVDAYDAMTSHRVYRQPFSSEKAREELERCSGHQFDPWVVAAFLQVLDGQEPSGHVHFPLGRKHFNGERLRNLSITRYLVTLAETATLASAPTDYLVGNRIGFSRKSLLHVGSLHQETNRYD